jgi:hypothetical protein
MLAPVFVAHMERVRFSLLDPLLKSSTNFTNFTNSECEIDDLVFFLLFLICVVVRVA